MAEELSVSSRPELERPILIAAFRGWNDGGQGASLATGYLAKLWDAKRFAEIEPENFFDFQATRPHVSLEEGVTRRIDWPSTVFYHGRPPGLDRDVVLLLGIEPNLRWRTFSELIVGFLAGARDRAGRQPRRAARRRPAHAPVPGHGSAATRSSSSGSASRRRATRARPGSSACSTTRAGRPGSASASLWAAVPHYVSLTPSPKAALALCERLADCSGRRSTRPSSPRLRRTTRSRSRRRSRPIRTRRPTSKSSSSARTRSPRRRSCPPETLSRPSSRGSCATASARTATTSPSDQ